MVMVTSRTATALDLITVFSYIVAILIVYISITILCIGEGAQNP